MCLKPAKAAIAVDESADSKLSVGKRCSATYASQHSCPKSCKLFGTICYAERGRVGMITRRLNASVTIDSDAIAHEEAEAIRHLTARFPLRLHVVGDCSTNSAAAIVSEAAREYSQRAGFPVWSYTHGWNEVDRSSWQDVSILASCEEVSEVVDADARGYAAALVVTEHEKPTAYPIGFGFTGVPCPQQTGRAASCVDCKLCHRADTLRDRKLVILFASHGVTAEKAQEVLG